MMPGGDAEAYKHLQPIVEKVAAQTDDGPCVTYIGPGGAGVGGVVWVCARRDVHAGRNERNRRAWAEGRVGGVPSRGMHTNPALP